MTGSEFFQDTNTERNMISNKDVHGGKQIREGFLKYLELQLMILQFTKQVTCVTFANHTNLLGWEGKINSI